MRRAVSKKKWERVKFVAKPRSAYLLSGPARMDWEHSIPQMDALRYSITYRNVREDRNGMEH
jgi:alkylated DNA repair dioxygenase AlkB